MGNDKVRSLIENNCNLPPIPMVTSKALAILNNPDSTLAQLEKVINKDSILVSRILNLANSSYYSTLQKIKSVRTAMSLVGYKALGNLIISASMKQLYGKFSLLDKMLWEHSVGTAITSATLSSEFKLTKPDEAMVAGLLHDIGKTIIAQSKPEEYREIAENVYNENLTYFEIEKKVLGFTHCDVGSYLVQKWNFPIELGKVIHYHHRVEQIDLDSMDISQVKIIAVVDIANKIMHRMGIGYREPKVDVVITELQSWQLLGIQIKEENMEGLLGRLKTTIEEETKNFA